MISLLLLASAGPSFDCAKASHPKLDADLAALYREKLKVIFDTAAFRGQQRDWQAILRTHCAAKCDAAQVATEYQDQITSLQGFETEDFEANYKTADIAYLHIEHHDAKQFGFSLRRSSVDDDSKNYCTLPRQDGTYLVATMTGPNNAWWQSGADQVDFTFNRDRVGALTELVLTGSPSTKRFCKGNYAIDDRFVSASTWVAGNQ